MKINIDIEMTPEEMRRLFGLPDLQAFHDQWLADLRERMTQGADGYDPTKLMQSYVSGTMASWDLFQRMASDFSAAAKSGSGGETK